MSEQDEVARMRVERDLGFKRGASFLVKDDQVMFQFVNDAASVIGPRKASKFDKEQFPGEWEEFNKGRLPQLDHDGDGEPGGSLPRPRGRPPKPKD